MDWKLEVIYLVFVINDLNYQYRQYFFQEIE